MHGSRAARTGKVGARWLVGECSSSLRADPFSDREASRAAEADVSAQAHHAERHEGVRGAHGGAGETGASRCGIMELGRSSDISRSQLSFDIEHAYAEFFRSLSGKDDQS